MDGLRNGQTLAQTTAEMDVNSTIAEFVHRYQSLSVHRDTQDNLIKVHTLLLHDQLFCLNFILGPHSILRVSRR